MSENILILCKKTKTSYHAFLFLKPTDIAWIVVTRQSTYNLWCILFTELMNTVAKAVLPKFSGNEFKISRPDLLSSSHFSNNRISGPSSPCGGLPYITILIIWLTLLASFVLLVQIICTSGRHSSGRRSGGRLLAMT